MMNRAQLHLRTSSHFSFRMRQNLSDQVIAAVAGAMSRVFNSDRTRTILVGVNPTTRLLANELEAIGNRVSLVSSESEAGPDDETVAADEIVLTRAGVQSARCLLAALTDGDHNVRLCRTAIDKFGVPVVIARLQLLDGITSWARFTDSGMSRMSWNDLIKAMVPDEFFSHALSRIARADDREQITELEVRLPVFVGRSIDDLPLEDCEVVALTRNNAPIYAYHDTALEMGDVLTLIGMKAAMNKVRAAFASL